jgi:hypothetical protein
MSKTFPVNIYKKTVSADMFIWSLQQMLYVVSMHFNTTFISCLPKILGFNRISWQVFSTRCCSTSKSLISAEYTKVFRCPHSQKSKGLLSGDCAGQMTEPLCPIHCSLKVWFRCCLTVQRKWDGAPSCMNYMLSLMRRHMFQAYW